MHKVQAMDNDYFRNIKGYYQSLAPGLKDDEWRELEVHLKVRHIKKGEFIDKQGRVATEVYWVEEGLMRSYQIIDGKESISSFFARHTYGSVYDSFLTRMPSNYFVDAVEDSTLICLDYKTMQSFYNKTPALERFGRKIAEMLFVLLSKRVHSLMNESAEKRYRDFVETWPQLQQQLPLYMVASYIGVTPEALSRIRKRTVL
jgi:CRP-like cAMP-binding protein